MLRCTALHRTELYSIALYCIALKCTKLYCTALCRYIAGLLGRYHAPVERDFDCTRGDKSVNTYLRAGKKRNSTTQHPATATGANGDMPSSVIAGASATPASVSALSTTSPPSHTSPALVSAVSTKHPAKKLGGRFGAGIGAPGKTIRLGCRSFMYFAVLLMLLIDVLLLYCGCRALQGDHVLASESAVQACSRWLSWMRVE